MDIRNRAVEMSGALQRRIVPELRYSQTQYEEHLRGYVRGATSWLDVGCGHQLLPPWRAEAEAELLAQCPRVVGIDYDLDSLRRHQTIRNVCRCDVAMLPFADESFDLVTANMVVEHLSDPAAQFREIARVLRPGGTFLFHTPNTQSYLAPLGRLLSDGMRRQLASVLEGRAAEDVFPTYYRANTDAAVREIAGRVGLEVSAVHFTGSVPITSAVPPLAALELLLLRQLMRRPALARYRQTLICALRRPTVAAAAPGRAGREPIAARG